MRNLIIYGGTFDPIHNGHIETALNIQNHFHFERFLFLPCKVPILKNQAEAMPAQRVKMIELAIAPHDKHGNFDIDLSEINRDTPSYMVDSLQHFRAQFGNGMAITLLMGTDTFNQLPRWHKWLKLLTLGNILVINRAGFHDQPTSDPLKKLITKHETFDGSALTKQTHGLIYRYDAGNYDFSSSWIRKQLHRGTNMQGYLPPAVLEYIKQNNLYF